TIIGVVESDPNAGGLLTTLTLYNHEGNAIEEQYELDGLQFTWEYDDESKNPLQRGNLLVARQHPTTGGASGENSFPPGALDVTQALITTFEYEPLTQQLLSEAVVDDATQMKVRETRYFYEYMESQNGIDAARDHLEIFGLVQPGVDPLASVSPTGDKNGDG